jgi:hypothetical protein
MNIQSSEVYNLLTGHCYRVIDNMDHDDLISYAMQMMMQSFDKDPGQGNTDLSLLIADMLIAEGDDEDSVSEFISGAVDLEDEEIDELIANPESVTVI